MARLIKQGLIPDFWLQFGTVGVYDRPHTRSQGHVSDDPVLNPDLFPGHWDDDDDSADDDEDNVTILTPPVLYLQWAVLAIQTMNVLFLSIFNHPLPDHNAFSAHPLACLHLHYPRLPRPHYQHPQISSNLLHPILPPFLCLICQTSNKSWTSMMIHLP